MDWEGARRLKVAERYVAEGERHMAQARQAIQGAMVQGRDRAPAETMLRWLELFQVMRARPTARRAQPEQAASRLPRCLRARNH